MPRARLTEALDGEGRPAKSESRGPSDVRRLACPKDEERTTYFDATKRDTPRGFALRVTANGTRTYALKFYVKGTGSRGWLTVGEVGVLTLNEARRRADEKSKLARDGKDPRFVATAGNVSTIPSLVAAYIEALRGNAAPKTLSEYTRLLDVHVKKAPELKAPVQDVTSAHISALVQRLGKDNGPYIANRTFGLVSAACRWARGMRKTSKKVHPPKVEHRIERNPCAEMTAPFSESKRERVLSDEEVVRVWLALEKVGADVAAYVKFLVLVGLRLTEAACLLWRDVNLKEKTVTVPGAIRKGGRVHMVYLAPLASTVLSALPGSDGSDPVAPVFGAAARRVQVNSSRVLRQLQKATEERDDKGKVTAAAVQFTPHDLRRTCASGCAKTGADLPTISRVLGHAVFAGALPVTVQYAMHGYATETRRAVERWATYVERLLADAAGDEKRGADVVSMPARRGKRRA